MQKIFLIAGAIQGALSVMIGAFGAHALKKLLLENGRTEVFETAVKYQFYHTFGLLIIGVLVLLSNNKFFHYAGYSFIVGTIIFSGSLYILSISNVPRWGAVTPFGGLFLIAGWILMLYGIIKS